MKVLDIIKNLVREDENRSHKDHLSELVPIDLVFRGYSFWGGKRRALGHTTTSMAMQYTNLDKVELAKAFPDIVALKNANSGVKNP